MANDLTVNPMRVDTAAATVLFANPMKIKSLRIMTEGVSAAGDDFEVQDSDNNTIWKGTASGAEYTEEVLLERWVKNGIKVPTLAAALVLFITYS